MSKLRKSQRDARANMEKQEILNPEGLAEKKKKKRKLVWICTLAGILALVVICVIGFQIIRIVGKSSLEAKAGETTPDLTPITATQTITEEEESKWQEGWVKYDGKIYAYNEDIRTFLFMGIDKNSDVKEVAEGTDGGQADALFLAVMDPHKETIQIIGINRNTMTDIDIYNEQGAYVTTTKAQIAVQHGFGNGVEESCEYQKEAVQKLFYGLPIHGYAAINMSAIPTINDAVGGVDIVVLEDLTKIDSTLVKGTETHLMGQSAFWYVKYRDTNVFASADGRLARQKQYLTSFIGAAKGAAKKNIGVAVDIYSAISKQMTTDISADEVAYLAPILAGYHFDSENLRMMEGETVMGEEFEEFYADEEALYQMILDVFYEEVAE